MERPLQVKPKAAPAFFFALFGFYLLVGACIAFSSGRWPGFMPPQLDALVLPLSFLSQLLGAVAGALVAGACGVFCIAFGFRLLRESPHA